MEDSGNFTNAYKVNSHWKGSPGNPFKAPKGCRRVKSEESWLKEKGAAVSDLEDRR